MVAHPELLYALRGTGALPGAVTQKAIHGLR